MQEEDSQTCEKECCQKKERGKSNKITKQRGEFHFLPATPGAGGMVVGILV